MGVHYIHAPKANNGKTSQEIILQAVEPEYLEGELGEKVTNSTLIPIPYRDSFRDEVFAALKEHGLLSSESVE